MPSKSSIDIKQYQVFRSNKADANDTKKYEMYFTFPEQKFL